MTSRTLVKNLAAATDGPVTVSGWVDTVRDQKKVQFIVLRDESGSPLDSFSSIISPGDSVALTNSGSPVAGAYCEFEFDGDEAAVRPPVWNVDSWTH